MSPLTELIGGAKAYGWGSFAAAGDFESIATVSLSGSAANVEFTSIPATYSHLQVRVSVKASGGSGISNNLVLTANNDTTAANYTYHRLSGDGANAGANSGTNMGGAYVGSSTPGASGSTNVFGSYVIDILDYANTNKYKTFRSLTGNDINGSGVIWFGSCLYLSTSAISSIKVYIDGLNIAQYSSFALYGIRSA